MPHPLDDDKGFLSRWSRRKRSEPEATPEATPQSASQPPVDATEAVGDAPSGKGGAPITPEELAALPRVEDLIPGADIRGFLRPGVPAALKNAALRRIWMLTPAIRDHADPAVDYAWDWNTPGGVPGDGLAPTPERAAEMLRALRQQPEPPAPDLAEADPESPEDPSDPATPVRQSTAAPEVARPADAAGSGQMRQSTAADAQQHAPRPSSRPDGGHDALAPNDQPPPRYPRHGGARPT